jgi:hypothetical protein
MNGPTRPISCDLNFMPFSALTVCVMAGQVDLHGEKAGGDLENAQVKMMKGALEFGDKEVCALWTALRFLVCRLFCGARPCRRACVLASGPARRDRLKL